jgi:hypothetical protein
LVSVNGEPAYEIVGAPAFTVNVTVAVVLPPEFVAVTVYTPAGFFVRLGVPEITPVLVLKLSPVCAVRSGLIA